MYCDVVVFLLERIKKSGRSPGKWLYSRWLPELFNFHQFKNFCFSVFGLLEICIFGVPGWCIITFSIYLFPRKTTVFLMQAQAQRWHSGQSSRVNCSLNRLQEVNQTLCHALLLFLFTFLFNLFFFLRFGPTHNRR